MYAPRASIPRHIEKVEKLGPFIELQKLFAFLVLLSKGRDERILKIKHRAAVIHEHMGQFEMPGQQNGLFL